MRERAPLDSTVLATVDLVKAQNYLLDYTGHVAPMPKRRRDELVSTIQALRRQLGWPALDIKSRSK